VCDVACDIGERLHQEEMQLILYNFHLSVQNIYQMSISISELPKDHSDRHALNLLVLFGSV
jgi:hypothetical protein